MKVFGVSLIKNTMCNLLLLFFPNLNLNKQEKRIATITLFDCCYSIDNFGSKLGALLALNGLTQEKAAEIMHVDKSTVSRAVRGKVYLASKMDDYAKVANVPDPRYLCTNKNYSSMSMEEKQEAIEVEAFGIKTGDKLYGINPAKRKLLMKHIEALINLEEEEEKQS